MARYRVLLLLFAVQLLVQPLRAADKAQLARTLQSAAEHSSLDSSGLRPWHLALEVTLFDKDGKNPIPATVELWKADNKIKMIESAGGTQIITIRSNGNLFRTSAHAPEFVRLELLVGQILHPIPEEFLQPGVKLTEEKPSISKIPLDCISPSLPAPSTSVIFIGQQLSFCLKRDTDSLLVSYAPGDVINLRQQVGSFQSKEVPIDLKILSGKIPRSEAKITKLETFNPQPNDFTPTNDMSPFTGPVEATPTDLINSVLSKTPPSYPVAAKARGASGSVNFDALIGLDGHVTSLQPKGTFDPSLAAAAQNAVRQWVYRPFLLCGVPVPVSTMITVNFNLN